MTDRAYLVRENSASTADLATGSTANLNWSGIATSATTTIAVSPVVTVFRDRTPVSRVLGASITTETIPLRRNVTIVTEETTMKTTISSVTSAVVATTLRPRMVTQPIIPRPEFSKPIACPQREFLAPSISSPTRFSQPLLTTGTHDYRVLPSSETGLSEKHQTVIFTDLCTHRSDQNSKHASSFYTYQCENRDGMLKSSLELDLDQIERLQKMLEPYLREIFLICLLVLGIVYLTLLRFWTFLKRLFAVNREEDQGGDTGTDNNPEDDDQPPPAGDLVSMPSSPPNNGGSEQDNELCNTQLEDSRDYEPERDHPNAVQLNPQYAILVEIQNSIGGQTRMLDEWLKLISFHEANNGAMIKRITEALETEEEEHSISELFASHFGTNDADNDSAEDDNPIDG